MIAPFYASWVVTIHIFHQSGYTVPSVSRPVATSRQRLWGGILKSVLKVLLVGSVVLLVGCAATVQREASSESTLAISAAASKRVIMVIEGSKASTASEDWQQLCTEWRNALEVAAKEAHLSGRGSTKHRRLLAKESWPE